MKTAGIVGGIAPESTIQYYRQIVGLYRDRTRDNSYPPVIINSIDMTRMLDLVGAARLDDLTDFLLSEIGKLEKAGAGFAVLASNTPHVVFEALQSRCAIPLISIVQAAADAAAASGMQRVGLLGTRFTMSGRLYPELFAAMGMEVVSPDPAEQDYVHEKYMGELVRGVFLPETRSRLLAIVSQLRDRHGIDGVVLGGTELPLILTEPEHEGLRFLDTTRLHVARIVDAILAP